MLDPIHLLLHGMEPAHSETGDCRVTPSEHPRRAAFYVAFGTFVGI